MRTFLRRALIALCVLAGGAYLLWRTQCQQAPPPVMVVEERLIGTWEGDLGPVYAELLADSMAPEELAAFVDGLAYLETFGRDGSRTQVQRSGAEEQSAEGTWESLSSDGDAHRIRLTLEQGGSAFDEGELIFAGDDTFELRFDTGGGPLAGKNVTFRRVRPSSTADQ